MLLACKHRCISRCQLSPLNIRYTAYSLTNKPSNTVICVSSESQELFMCGWNNKGQLGLGDTQDRSVLCHVQGLGSVRQVSCGWNHTLVITGNT